MNNATAMKDSVTKKNGTYGGVMKWFGQTVPVPMTTNFDVIACSAFAFTVLRNFYLSKELQVYTFDSVRSEGGAGTVWHKVGDTWTSNNDSRADHETGTDWISDLASGQDGHTPIAGPPNFPPGSEKGLDVYLSLPAFQMVDSTRKLDNATRFCPNWYAWQSTSAAAKVRADIESGHTFATGWLVAFDSKFATSHHITDAGYLAYLESGILLWDNLIDSVVGIKGYVLPVHAGVKGEMFASFAEAKNFWETIARIFLFISRDAGEYSNKLTWGDRLDNAANAYKEGVEEFVQSAAKDAGAAAAWGANQAGEALGGGFSKFVENVGLWGLAFVALLIAFR